MIIPPAMFDVVAERFKVLGEPARLRILYALKKKEMTVTELTDATGLGQANMSKHLQLLYTHGFVVRRKDGLYVCYSLADQSVFQLCDIMCGRLEREFGTQYRKLPKSSRKSKG